jgi:ATP-dependent protease ClpP protease subunit
MNAANQSVPIDLYVNSAGRNVPDGLAIYDAMLPIKAPMVTYRLSCAASMAAVLLEVVSSCVLVREANSRTNNRY